MNAGIQAADGLEGPTQRRGAVITALGITQILAWGSSYYLPAVLAKPIAADGDTKTIDPPKKPGKKAPGKLPPRPAADSKDSREAASDMLKKFFNRR